MKKKECRSNSFTFEKFIKMKEISIFEYDFQKPYSNEGIFFSAIKIYLNYLPHELKSNKTVERTFIYFQVQLYKYFSTSIFVCVNYHKELLFWLIKALEMLHA